MVGKVGVELVRERRVGEVEGEVGKEGRRCGLIGDAIMRSIELMFLFYF